MDTSQYADGPLRLADSDGDFWIWNDAMERGEWHDRPCGDEDCTASAVMSLGGTIIRCAPRTGGCAIDAESDGVSFLCVEHFTERVASAQPSNIKDLVTLALFEHEVEPDVIADVGTKLDQLLGSTFVPEFMKFEVREVDA